MTDRRDQEYRDCAERVAREILGEPNKRLCNGKVLRWGTNGSMSLKLESWAFFSHEINEGGGVRWLVGALLHLDEAEISRWLHDRGYVSGDDRSKAPRKIVATYAYCDEGGAVAFQVIRYGPKDFRQRRPAGGGWSRSVKGVRQVPYRLPELLEAIASERPVIVVEGEKDVDALARWGVPATCNAGGAGKWKSDLNEHFRGADVILVPDNDEAGYRHVEDVGAKLSGIALRLRVLILPGLKHKGDSSDWIASGGTAEVFWQLVEAAPDRIKQTKPDGPAKPTWRDNLIDPQKLCDEHFPEVKYVIPGLFPEGVTLLASRPKLCKSWLILQITTAVANGTTTLVASDHQIQGDVLYLALEDNPRRLQRRLAKYFGAQRETWPKRLALFTAWRRLDQGGIQDLREWCRSIDKPTLIAIDTLKKVRKPKGRNQSDYDADYEACEGLMGLAKEFPGLSIIIAHHDRKMDADDVFDTVSGTLGLTGGVDTIAVMKGKEGNPDTLHIEGRDLLDSVKKAITFDRETCRLAILGEAAEVQRSVERQRVLGALAKVPEGLPIAEIIGSAGLAGTNAAYLLLSKMTDTGEIERIRRGLYGLPGTRANLSRKKQRQERGRDDKLLK